MSYNPDSLREDLKPGDLAMYSPGPRYFGLTRKIPDPFSWEKFLEGLDSEFPWRFPSSVRACLVLDIEPQHEEWGVPEDRFVLVLIGETKAVVRLETLTRF